MKFFIKSIVLIYVVLHIVSCSHKKSTEINQTAQLDTLDNIWSLDPQSHGIQWNVKKVHKDHIEFSGLKVSGIITYGIDKEGELILDKKVVWPMLRTIPNDTHASLIHDFGKNENTKIKVNNLAIKQEKPYQINFNGILTIKSKTELGLEITRTLFPSTTKPVIIEQITIFNKTTELKTIAINKLNYLKKTSKNKGVYGSYLIEISNTFKGTRKLETNEQFTFSQIYKATKENEKICINVNQELKLRKEFLAELNESLVFESPDSNLNQMFSFAKIRAAESIFETKGGLMHGPGGSRYYAAIWANDQAEYINPFFPFLGNTNGNESAINSFKHFARFMNPEWKPIPSSIVAEGDDIWNGAGDRGDAAMIAYGASRFALAYGDKNTADSLLPLINWCLEYCEQNMLAEGIIASDCDELENRFPAGKANLTTNMLAYGGYMSTANLLKALNQDNELALNYKMKAIKLKQACENYFGGNIQGFDTYKYFRENKKLRSWICIPLTMGIFDRKDETLKALLSDKLWNKNGIFTEAGDSTFWDRATLYAFRGILKAGEVDVAMKYFKYYSQKRLLGNHVPYAVEAFPEGNQRHLSAESGLYCRVITEGLFAIEPIGLKKFKCTPRLPKGWSFMKLKNIKAFQSSFDIEVSRKGNDSEIIIKNNNQVIKKIIWDENSVIEVSLK